VSSSSSFLSPMPPASLTSPTLLLLLLSPAAARLLVLDSCPTLRLLVLPLSNAEKDLPLLLGSLLLERGPLLALPVPAPPRWLSMTRLIRPVLHSSPPSTNPTLRLGTPTPATPAPVEVAVVVFSSFGAAGCDPLLMLSTDALLLLLLFLLLLPLLVVAADCCCCCWRSCISCAPSSKS